MTRIFALAFLSLIITPWVPSQTDINGDGVLNGIDIQSIVDVLIGEREVVPAHDVNDDGEVNAVDLVKAVNEFYANPMIPIAAGTFTMGGIDGPDYGFGGTPVHQVTLSAYEMGRYEVTNAEYAAFLNGAWASGEIEVNEARQTVRMPDGGAYLINLQGEERDCQITFTGSGFTVPMRDGQSMENHPVLDVSWFGAAAYCNWLSRQHGYDEVYNENAEDWPHDLSRNGYHLPTEAQWERAATWEAETNRRWRFATMSDSIDGWKVNYVQVNPHRLTEYPFTSQVGLYRSSSSDVGCFDMSGNVWEWCNDWYEYIYPDEDTIDPEGPEKDQNLRRLRGGAWYTTEIQCRAARRERSEPDRFFTGYGYGFRVARNP